MTKNVYIELKITVLFSVTSTKKRINYGTKKLIERRLRAAMMNHQCKMVTVCCCALLLVLIITT